MSVPGQFGAPGCSQFPSQPEAELLDEVYNLAIDDKSKQNAATIQYQIMDMASNKAILDTSETSAALGDNSANSDQLTVRRSVPLTSLQPGKYQVTITVNDHVSKQQVAQSAPFTVD